MLALGLLLALSGSCRFTQAGDDVVFACEPQGRCASADQVCSLQNLCLPKNQAIRILQPENNAQVQGATRVEVVLDVAGVEPESLVLTITKQGQGPTTLTLRRQPEDRYVAQWTPSQGAGQYELRVRAPEQGLESAPVTVVLGGDSPAFSIEVPVPEGAPSVGALTVRDPQAPTAWRRDERVVVTITSDEAELDANSVRLVVVGAAASGDGRAEPPVAPRRVPTCTHAYCGVVELDLSVPELSRFRGPFKLRVTGTDQAGNSVSGLGEVQVTRWKWELDAQREIVTSLAIGAAGRIYIGTRSGTGGEVLRIRPDGVVDTRLTTEAPYDALAIGPSTVGGSEVLFLSTQTGNQPPKLSALKVNDGQVLGQCSATGLSDRGTSRLTVGSGLASDGSRKDVAVIGFYKRDIGRLEFVGLRLEEPVGTCLVDPPRTEGSFSALLTDGERFYYSVSRAQAMSAEVSGFQPQAAITCDTGPARLVLVGSELIANRSSDGAGNRVNLQTGVCRGFELGGREGTESMASATVDAQARLFYGKSGTNGRSYLTRSPLEPGGTTPGTVERELPEPLLLAPMLGQGGWVYTSTDEGRHQAWTRELTFVWEAPQLEQFRGIEGLDCARDIAGQPQPRPGVWYMAHGSRLRALIVDSHGLDTEAKWPKGQRDPRNNGNSSVDLRQFACP
jgi:hypothetical protein